jgi:hypothetical protein
MDYYGVLIAVRSVLYDRGGHCAFFSMRWAAQKETGEYSESSPPVTQD